MADCLALDIGTALFTEYDDDGFPTVQIDGLGGEDSGVVPYEMHSPHGLISRCHDPEEGLGCQVLYGLEGGRGHAWVQSDPRVVPNLPPQEKGGTCLYGGKLKNPSFHNIAGDTGTQTFYVPYAFAGDTPTKAMVIDVNVDNDGNEAITIGHGSGALISIVESAGATSILLKGAGGQTYLEINDEAVVVNGPLVVNGGMTSGIPGTPTHHTLAEPLVAILTQLFSLIAAIPGGQAAAAMAAQLPGIIAQHSSGS